ncbi:MAG: EamA family transporter [Pyrinomonadaceae bacterium]|nr:EamA family transporter [Pyrinomonadaceae bacterium]
MKILVWLILCGIWGTTWLFIKVGLDDLPPLTFAALRFILAVIVLGAIIAVQRIPLPKSGIQWRLLAITGVLQFSINYSLVFWSEVYISSGLAAVLQATIPVFGLVLAWIYLPEESITWVKIFALVIGILGVGIVFIEQLRVNSIMAFAGSVGIVIGAYAAAHASILTKAKGGGIHPASLVFGQMVCGTLPIIIIALIKEGNPLNYSYSGITIISILYLSIFGTILTFWLYYWLLSRIESTKAMTIALVTPLIAVIGGSIFLDEKLLLQTLIGGALILASVGLIVFRKKLKPKLIVTEN